MAESELLEKSTTAPVGDEPTGVVVSKKERYGFIDQLRGLTIFFFVLADITWVWSGKITASPPILPVGPTWFNHGWKFFGFDPKNMITLVDIGQLLFVFVMGLLIPMSWERHKARGGTKTALGQLTIRLVLFYLIAGVMDDFDLIPMFLSNTFGVLAAAMLLATLAYVLVKDPQKRFYLNLVLIGLLTVLYALPAVREWENSIFGVDTDIDLIPLNLLGAAITCIQGGITMQWFTNAEDKKKVFKEKIIPFGIGFYILAFFIDYFYPADHHAMNTSMTAMSVAAAMLLFWAFYSLEKFFEFKIPGMDTFGRNTLLVFILAYPFQTIVWDMWMTEDFRMDLMMNDYGLAVMYGLLSIVVMFALFYVVLVPLDRKGFFFTPSIFIRAFQSKKKGDTTKKVEIERPEPNPTPPG